jgi:hypothetical protein
MALSERDLFGSPFGLNDEVQVRGTVIAITGASGNTANGYGGSADRVTVLVDTPGNAGEAVGVTFSVSPTQIRRSQGPATGPAAGGPSFH